MFGLVFLMKHLEDYTILNQVYLCRLEYLLFLMFLLILIQTI